MKAKILIRTEASPTIGLGHMVRCVALAQMLKGEFEIVFYCYNAPESIELVLKENGFLLVKPSNDFEFFSAIDEASIVVLDGYQFDSNYQLQIKSEGASLVVIDDLHDKEYFADLIINSVPGISAIEYHAQLYTHFALGLDYVLLRSCFLEQAKLTRDIDNIDSVLVCFGGSDPQNLTLRTLSVLIRSTHFKRIVVVTGPLFKEHDSLNSILNADARVILHKDASSELMLDLFLQVDLLVVPTSGLFLEALASGSHIVSGWYIENQKRQYYAFRNKNFFIDAGNFSPEQIEAAIAMALKGWHKPKKIIDGNSDKRLRRRFWQVSVESQLSLRRAKGDDLLLTYRWATDEVVRAFSFSKHSITWEEHLDWFQAKIGDKNCFYYICEFGEEVIGSVRFDLDKGDAKISYLIEPRFHAKGFGLPLLAKGFKVLLADLNMHSSQIKKLIGFVDNNNHPSIKTFVNLGFKDFIQEGKLKFVKSLYGEITSD